MDSPVESKSLKDGSVAPAIRWDSEPSELIYFKVYKSQIPVIEQAIESAALMPGSDKSRATAWR